MLQTTLLLLVLWNVSHQVFFRYAFLILVSLLQLTFIPTINAHLEELDAQVTYRIKRHASFYEKQRGKDETAARFSGRGGYKPPINEER